VWFAILGIVCSCCHVGPPRSISVFGYLHTCIRAPGDRDGTEDGSQASSANSTANAGAASFAPHISALSSSNRGVGSFIAQSPIAGMHGPQGSHRLMSGQPVGGDAATPTPAAKRARTSPSVSPSSTAVEMASAWEHLVKPMTIEERFPDLDGCLLLEAIQNSYRDCS
jgi:hypothetical protein